MRKMKDSGIEWIGEIPKGWDTIKLSYLFKTIGSGTTPSSTNSEYYDGEFNWLQTGDLNDKEIVSTSKTITQKAVDDYSVLTLYKIGTVVMAMYGATIGKLGILSVDSYTNQACCAMSDPINIEPKYVYYWLMSNKENIVKLSLGGGQPNISQGIISALKVTIPESIEIQNKIVKYLDQKCAEIDALIKAKEKTNALLKEQRQSIIYEAVTKGLDPNAPMKDSGIEWIGKIPESWSISPIKYSYCITLGKMLQPSQKKEDDELCPYICAINLKWKCVDLSEIKQMWFSQREKNAYRLQKGDLLVTEGGDVAVSCIWNDEINECYFQNAIHRVRPKKNNSNRFLYYWMHVLKNSGYIDLVCNKATLAHYTKDKFEATPMPKISFDEQISITNYLDQKCTEIDALIESNNKTIEKLKEYRKSVIFEAVTGKVEVY